MGHDIFGFNKAGKEIAYARFSMGNHHAAILYTILDANKYNAGVSGSADSSTYSVEQIEKALNEFKESYLKDSSMINWNHEQILNFIQSCLATAKKEGHVKVYFG
ncbi:hypothetical protein [Ureibacillus acetophenoni]|uniref:Uncharacterized protein n=1 Tax=Ureibacillus acetophenoni TaxID=614649 RepID=A0A285UK50_9BACL|nr:hypothetical protein [Ureibacillus acetophenoni]SOC40621.1 hypothetical protein SAMN05877842_10890 [Ureibacillus acetophenoni]